MSDGAVPGDISLRRAVLDWRDWWEVETEQLLTMAAKALILDLGDIHDSYSVLRSIFKQSGHEARIDAAIIAWAEDITRRLPMAAGTELALLLRQEHAAEAVIEKVRASSFDGIANPGISRLRELAPTGRARMRELVRSAVLGDASETSWQGQSLRGAMLDHLKRLEAITVHKD